MMYVCAETILTRIHTLLVGYIDQQRMTKAKWDLDVLLGQDPISESLQILSCLLHISLDL